MAHLCRIVQTVIGIRTNGLDTLAMRSHRTSIGSVPPYRWRTVRVVCLLVLSGVAAACNAPHMENVVIPQLSKQTLDLAASKSVLFAHQSVGYDILDGVATVTASSGVQLKVAEARNHAPRTPGIFHFQVGKNRDPTAKIEDFANTFAQGGFDGIDIAMVKLCYVDIDEQSDASRLAHDYVAALETLKHRYVGTRFVAVTAPLTTVQTGPKAWIKTVLGRVPYGYAENATRTAFNEQLRRSLAPADIFDLARWEATGAKQLTFEGKPIESLNPALTTDGGHLNEQGRRLLATALLEFIARDEAVGSRL